MSLEGLKPSAIDSMSIYFISLIGDMCRVHRYSSKSLYPCILVFNWKTNTNEGRWRGERGFFQNRLNYEKVKKGIKNIGHLFRSHFRFWTNKCNVNNWSGRKKKGPFNQTMFWQILLFKVIIFISLWWF